MRRYTLPAPIGGWNARDALDMMPETDGIDLENLFPNQSYVELRRGHESYATGFTGAVESLMPYASGTASALFAANNNAIYDISSSGAIGAADISGLSNDRWQHVNFATSGGQYLWICNGADQERYYDGTSWATAALTGITAGDVISVTVFKSRLFFVLNDYLGFAYLPVDSIAGAVTKFPLGAILEKGGKIIAIGNWTRDGGDGLDDLVAFVSDRGQVAIYQGSNPDSASDWSLVGKYDIGVPIGTRCLARLGADLVVITEDGYFPLSRALETGRTASAVAISDKISGAVRRATRLHRGNFGWQPILYPRGGYMLFNVPVTTTTFEQHVVNLTTGAWCRFTGQNGYCWAVHNDELYFGASGEVFKADTGNSDDGAAILAGGKSAFSYFNNPGSLKLFQMMRPVLSADGTLPVSLGFDVDFKDGASVYTPSPISSSGAKWDEAVWDTATWAADTEPVTAWRSISGLGYTGAARVRTSTTAQNVRWHSTQVSFQEGVGI